MTFFNQPPPQIGNQYHGDRVLKSFLKRHLNSDCLAQVAGELESMGELAGGTLLAQQLKELRMEPELTQWDAWGHRIDEIRLTPLWQQAAVAAAKSGLVGCAYEGNLQPQSRMVQFALVYLFHPSTDMYCCPLAMSDGAARVLLDSGNEALIQRAVDRLTSRDPARAWTSGQWMTESTGGSDLAGTETTARQDESGHWQLYGRKWFTSAATADMALTLARPQGHSGGSSGLALFYVEPRNQAGELDHIEILRLKQKLGTRKLPTAELVMNGTRAVPVNGLDGGVRNIAPMLNVTRSWNAVCSVSFMRRGLALARDYADRRVVFGLPLAEQPLHQVTLARQQVEFEAAFHLVFNQVRLMGLAENGRLSEDGQILLRLLIPMTKLVTGKQVVVLCSEVIECFGGAGYVEDTGLPQLLRDAQVMPIWEGTTNVLALDTLKVLGDSNAVGAYLKAIERMLTKIQDPRLSPSVDTIKRVTTRVREHFARPDFADPEQSGQARGLAMTLGRLFSLVLLADHGQYCLDQGNDPRPTAAANLFAGSNIDQLDAVDMDDAAMLASDIYA
jgi:alkylation response protein AidB-like acyl-CoA dehydrogenase